MTTWNFTFTFKVSLNLGIRVALRVESSRSLIIREREANKFSFISLFWLFLSPSALVAHFIENTFLFRFADLPNYLFTIIRLENKSFFVRPRSTIAFSLFFVVYESTSREITRKSDVIDFVSNKIISDGWKQRNSSFVGNALDSFLWSKHESPVSRNFRF